MHDKHTVDWTSCLSGFVCSGGSLTATRAGWLFGVGATYAFDPRWSVFVEYNYMDFGTTHGTVLLTETGTGGSLIETRTLDIDQTLQVVKAGVNVRF